MKKITILALHLNYGGIEKYIYSLTEMLKDNFDIEIISTYKIGVKPAFDFDKKIKIKYLIDGKPNRRRIFNSIKILFLKYYLNIKTIKRLDSDIVITTRTFHNSLVKKIANKKILRIATEHNSCNVSEAFNNKVIKSCNGFDYFVCVSKEMFNYYYDKVNAKVLYIPNVIISLTKKHSKLNNNELISVGRLSLEKGFTDLITIVRQIKDSVPKVHLTMCGDGPNKLILEKEIVINDLKDNISLVGFLNEKELEKKYLNSSLYVMTSFTESFGLVLIEAMNYGLPCIAFDSASGARELLTDTGVLISNRNKEAMANKIVELLRDRNQLEAYSKKSKVKVKEYLAENVKEKWLSILK